MAAEGPDAFAAAGAAPKSNRFDVLRQLASNPYQSAFEASIGDPSLSPLPLPQDKEAKFERLAEEVSKDLEAGDSSLSSQQQEAKAIYESIEGIVGKASPHPPSATQSLPPKTSSLEHNALGGAEPLSKHLNSQGGGVHQGPPTSSSPPAHFPTPSSDSGDDGRHRHTFVSQDGFPIDERSRLTPFKVGSGTVPKVTSALPEPKEPLTHPHPPPARPLAVLLPPASQGDKVKDIHDPPLTEHQGHFEGPPSYGRQQGDFSHSPPKPPHASTHLRFAERPVPVERPRLKDPPSLPIRRPPGTSKRPPPVGIPDTSEDFPGRLERPPPPFRRPRPLLPSRDKENIQHRPQPLLPNKHVSSAFHKENARPQGRPEQALTTQGPPRLLSKPFPGPTQTPATEGPLRDPFNNKRTRPQHEIQPPGDKISQQGFRSNLRQLPPPPPYVKEDLKEPIVPSTRHASPDAASDVLREFGLRPLPAPPKIEPPKLLSSEQILAFVESQNPNPRPKTDFDIGSSSKDESVLPPNSGLQEASVSRPYSPTSAPEERVFSDGTSLPELVPSNSGLFKEENKPVRAKTETSKETHENLPVLLPPPPPFVEFPGVPSEKREDITEVSPVYHTEIDSTTAHPDKSLSRLNGVALHLSQPELYQNPLPPSSAPPGKEINTSGTASGWQKDNEYSEGKNIDGGYSEDREASLTSFQNDDSLHNGHQLSRQPHQEDHLIEDDSWQEFNDQRKSYLEDGDDYTTHGINEHTQRSPPNKVDLTRPKFHQPGHMKHGDQIQGNGREQPAGQGNISTGSPQKDLHQPNNVFQKGSQHPEHGFGRDSFRQYGKRRFPQQLGNGHQGLPRQQEVGFSSGQLHVNKFHGDIHQQETDIQNNRNRHEDRFHRGSLQPESEADSKEPGVNFQIIPDHKPSIQPPSLHGKPFRDSRRDNHSRARHRGQPFKENKVQHQGLQIIVPSREKATSKHQFAGTRNPSSQIPATPLNHLRPPTPPPNFTLQVLTTPPTRSSQRRRPPQTLYRGTPLHPRPAPRTPHASGRKQTRFSASYSDSTSLPDDLRQTRHRGGDDSMRTDDARTAVQSQVPRTVPAPVVFRGQRPRKRPLLALPTSGADSPKELLSSDDLHDSQLLQSPHSLNKVPKEHPRYPEETLKSSHSLINFHFENPSLPDVNTPSPDNKLPLSFGIKQKETITVAKIKDQFDPLVKEKQTSSNNQINGDSLSTSPEMTALSVLSLFSPLSTSLSSSSFASAPHVTQDTDTHSSSSTSIEPITVYETLNPDVAPDSAADQSLPTIQRKETPHVSPRITPPPQPPHHGSPTQLPPSSSLLSPPPSTPSVSLPVTSPSSVKSSQSPEAVTSTTPPPRESRHTVSSPLETTTRKPSLSGSAPLHKLLSDSTNKETSVSSQTEVPLPKPPSQSPTKSPSFLSFPQTPLPSPETFLSYPRHHENLTPLALPTTTSSPQLSFPSPSPAAPPLTSNTPAPGSSQPPSESPARQIPRAALSSTTARAPPSSARPSPVVTATSEPQDARTTTSQPSQPKISRI
ncbi:uncharacterized protein LOC122255440 [Penaeus japonicus]|uniref:uncharacterized protein LOC122255440 n=1 Tax=Penaeus japonicus TaxID=27405 RepID=UPI001C71290A|nr:uncharacterized protein LOC122255440 [Penaeus japonicus]